MPRLATAALALVTFTLTGATAATAAPAQSTFRAGYETSIADFTSSRTVLKIPRANACNLGDGFVTVQAYELGRGDKVGASFTSRCKDGVASYTGTIYLGGAEPLDGPIRGGDTITVDIASDSDQTSVGVDSSAGWGTGVGTPEGFQLDTYTAYAAGKLGPGSDVGGLRTQAFKRITVGDDRLGELDSASFSDACSDVTALRHEWSFRTRYAC